MNALTTNRTTDPVAWLERHEPQDVNLQLRHSLESSLGVVPHVRFDTRYPENKPAVSTPLDCQFTGLTADNRIQALAKFEAAMTPAPRDRIEEWLAAMHAGTQKRKEDDAGLAVVLELYANVLARYPADVAKAACLGLTLSSKWFPTVSEVDAECVRLLGPRGVICSALRRWTPPSPESLEHRRRERSLDDMIAEADRLERSIPMRVRMSTPRSQWTGEHRTNADRADELRATVKAQMRRRA